MEKKLPRIKALLTPGEVAKRSGVAVSALHFYESKGLITSIRNSGNQRRYKRDVLRYVAIIKIAQRIGIPLATIREAFGVLPEGHTLSAKEWKQLSSQWREELDRRIHIFGRWLVNTLLYVVVGAGGATLLAIMGGYARAQPAPPAPWV